MFNHPQVTSVNLPEQTQISKLYEPTHLADAYAVELAADATDNPEQLARIIIGSLAPWARGLLNTRDAIVSVFGLKTVRQLRISGAKSAQNYVGPFKIHASNSTEVILGEDDSHLDFRLSILVSPSAVPGRNARVIFSTVVQCHNWLGRAYLFAITPFHRLIAMHTLGRAAQSGWLFKQK